MQLRVLDPQVKEQPWYAQGLAFSCTCSGNCCTGGPGFVWMSEEEITRLAEHLDITREETLKKYCRKMGRRISLKERRTPQGKYDCVFLTEIDEPIEGRDPKLPPNRKRVCGIYPVRPLQCRTWPFWEVNLETPAAWKRAARGCPGMNRGRHFTSGQIESLRDATEWPDKPPTSAPEK
jgi:Fe-S-cluster containining protein